MTRAWIALLAGAVVVTGCTATGPESPDVPAAVQSPGAGPSAAPDPDPATLQRIQQEFDEVGRLLSQSLFDEAFEAASRAIALAPDRVEPYEVLSRWYTRLNRHDLAKQSFEALSEGSLNGLRFLARHQRLSNDAAAALVTLDRCIERDAGHAGCRVERAMLYHGDGAFEASLEDLRRAYETDADTATAARLIESLRLNGLYAEIDTTVESALTADPDSAALMFARARSQLRNRDDRAAEQTLLRAIELDPMSAPGLRLLATVELRLGKNLEGLQRLAQADTARDYQTTARMLIRDFNAGPDPGLALLIAELNLTAGDLGQAQRWLQTAQAGGAPPQRLAAARAWAAYAGGDTARGDAEIFAAGGEDDGHACLARAARAVRGGDSELAGEWLKRAIVFGPDQRYFLRRAADLYRSMGDPYSAEDLRLRAATAALP